MLITKVKIGGFRSLSKVSIPSFDLVNVFFGSNNSGKSNILAALETCFRVDQKELPISGFYSSELRNFVDNFTIQQDGSAASKITISCSVRLLDEDLKRLPHLTGFLKEKDLWNAKGQSLVLDVEVNRVSEFAANRVLQKAVINGRIAYDASVPLPNTFFPELTDGTTTSREFATGELSQYLINSFHVIHTERFSLSHMTSGGVTDTSADLHEFKNSVRGLIESRGEDYKTFQKIQTWFSRSPFGFGNIRAVLSRGSVELIVTDGNNREFILERLGSGVQQLLILLFEIGLITSESKGNVKGNIFGIEELELNLSPKMQRQIFDMLAEMVKQPDASGFGQLFLTSHSRYMVREAEKGVRLYAVDMDGKLLTRVRHVRKNIKQTVNAYFGP